MCEHQISVEEWEESIFRKADHFTVFCRVEGQRYICLFSDVLDAMHLASNAPNMLVYAVTANGDSTCLIRSRWPRFIELRGMLKAQSNPPSAEAPMR